MIFSSFLTLSLHLFFCNSKTSIIPSSLSFPFSTSTLCSPFFPLLFRSLFILMCLCAAMSGDLAEAKCFLLSRCRWDCNKACQWEAWVALSHALCLLTVNPPPPSLSTPALPPLSSKILCLYSSFLICLPFLPHFILLLPEIVLLDLRLMSLSLSLWFPCQRHFQGHDEEEQQQETPLST